jgi:glycerol-1-phosphate dehydrogenase [NAD(P)+]
MVLAVGSGVINDLCKWACFDLEIPYVVVATAASMNGYAAANVAARIAGVKVLVEARPPVAVVAEPAVIEGAPSEMTAAGFGDMIARYQSHADWVMNNMLLGEYYCAYCAEMATDLERLYLKHPEDVRQAKSEAIKGLFEALFWTGAAMTLVGTSAPASGGEHLLSHTLDMMADLHNEKHDLHGRQVGLGTILSAAIYEKLLSLETPTFAELPEDVDAEFWTVPGVVKAVREQYLAKRPQLEMLRAKTAWPAVWDELRARLMAITKTPEQIKSWLLRAGAASTIADIGCSRERLRAAAMHMHEIRKRCTVVDLAWVLGILPAAVDEIIDERLID